MNIIFGAGSIMLIGYIGGQIASLIKLPALTGYILFGLIFGPYGLGLMTTEAIAVLKVPVSLVAVSIIAFMLGGDLTISSVQKMGKKLVNLAIIDSLVTFFLVLIGLFFIANQPLYIALPLAALATSPAPTVVVPIVKELKARGPFTRTLLMVSALEDITCVILISIAIAVSQPLIAGGVISPQILLFTLWEILGSILVGVAAGFLVTRVLRFIKGDQRLTLAITIILVLAGVTELIHLSALITILSVGFVVYNFGQETEELFKGVETVSTPVLLLFFTTAGASLNPGLIPAAGLAVAVYTVMRVVSKFTGGYYGAIFVGLDKDAYQNLRYTLLSQAGTTLGLTMLVAQRLPEVSEQILTVMLSAVIIFELIGPPLTRNTLIKLDEAYKGGDPSSNNSSGD